MSTFPDLCATMPISRECWVTKFISNIFRLSKYSRMLFESCRFLCCWAALHSLCWSLFNCWTVEFLHWFQRKQGLTEARWLTVLLSSIISLEEHIYILYDYPPFPPPTTTPTPTPHPQVRGHYLNSLDLHDQNSNLFRLDEPSQNVNLVHILRSQEGSSASPGGLLCQSLLSTSAGR